MSGTVINLPRPVLTPALRARVEQTIDWLVGLLDAVETPGEDLEPSLGAPEQRMTETVCIDGRWSTRHVSQDDWAAGSTDEREQDAGDEPEEENEHGDESDLEPSLGAPETTTYGETASQAFTWALSARGDREHDPAECGIMDGD